MVLSAYVFSVSSAELTSSIVDPFDWVFARIVCTAFIWVSYSAKPSRTEAVKALVMLFPASMAALVMRLSTENATAPMALKPDWTP